MTPIEIDVVLQLPVPVSIRWPDRDIEGTVAGAGIDTLVVASMKKTDSFIGLPIAFWFGRGNARRELPPRIIRAYDPETSIITVDEPWSPEIEESAAENIRAAVPGVGMVQSGEKWRIVPSAGDVYRIEVSERVELPRLGCDGLIPWLAEMTEERVAARVKAMEKMSTKDLANAKADAYLNCRAIVEDLTTPAQTPEGMRRILKASLDKSAVEPARRPVILEHLLGNPSVAYHLSRKICGLFGDYERRPAPKADPMAEAKAAFPGANLMAKEAPDPLASKPAATEGATASTG